MAIKQWLGGALGVRQISTVTIGGTAATGDTFTITLGFGSVTFTVTTPTDNTTIAAGLVALINASGVSPEFKDAAWTSATNVITAVGATAGVPFTITVSKVSTSGTIATATSTAATGRNFIDNASNWSGGTVPSTSDTLVFSGDTDDVLYGMADTGPFAEIQVLLDFQGNIGLPEQNPLGYREYRNTFCKWKASSYKIGFGVGRGSQLLKFDAVASAGNVVQVASGRSNLSDEPAVQFKGTLGTVIAQDGEIAIGGRSLETATVTTLTVGKNAKVKVGPQVSLTTVNTQGTTEVNSACTNLNVIDGKCTMIAQPTNVDVSGGTLFYESASTITQAYVGPGTLDCSDLRARTITTLNLRASGKVVDPRKTLTIGTLSIQTGVQSFSAA